MRRLGNLLAVAAAAAVVAVAGFDALSTGQPAPAPAEDEPPPAASVPVDVFEASFPDGRRHQLQALGASGRLVFADLDCTLRALTLPDLRVEREPPTVGCSAFRPPGRLGLRRGELAWFAVGDGHTTLLTRRQLATLVRDQVAPDMPVPETRFPIYSFRQVAWLGGRRFAALVADNRLQQEVLVVVEGSRVLRIVPGLGAAFGSLRASPRGAWLALVRSGGRLLLFDRDGRAAPVPELPPVRAVTWSPDERLLAAATELDVLVFGTGSAAEPVPLRLAALDVGWRP